MSERLHKLVVQIDNPKLQEDIYRELERLEVLPPRQPKAPAKFPVGTPVRVVKDYFDLRGDNLKGAIYYVKGVRFRLGRWEYFLCNLESGAGHNIGEIPEKILEERFGDHIKPYQGHDHYWKPSGYDTGDPLAAPSTPMV
jgi:hypothetical protein